jgi:hypothetical protein
VRAAFLGTQGFALAKSQTPRLAFGSQLLGAPPYSVRFFLSSRPAADLDFARKNWVRFANSLFCPGSSSKQKRRMALFRLDHSLSWMNSTPAEFEVAFSADSTRGRDDLGSFRKKIAANSHRLCFGRLSKSYARSATVLVDELDAAQALEPTPRLPRSEQAHS